MKNIKNWTELNEAAADQYLMVVHFESGDEIHLHILEFSHYAKIDEMINNNETDNLIDCINNNEIDHIMCQTYVLKDYIFNKYNIIKVIHIPELGM